MKKLLAILFSVIFLSCIGFVTYQKETSADSQFKTITESDAVKIAEDYAFKEPNMEWQVNQVVKEEDKWVVVFKSRFPEAMKIYINTETGKIVDVKTCCG